MEALRAVNMSQNWMFCVRHIAHSAGSGASQIRRSEQISRRDDQRIRLLYVMTVASTS